MKNIYVCSPLRGDIEENIRKAKEYSRKIALDGNLPVTPHLYLTTFLDDRMEEEREIGMAIALEWLKRCDEVYVFGEPSEGMKREIRLAGTLGIKIVRGWPLILEFPF